MNNPIMYRFHIEGVVQGVGFRPFIYTACLQKGLSGYVQNTGQGVVVVVDQKEPLERILENVPAGARIDGYSVQETNENVKGFSIYSSMGTGFVEIPPDLFLCDDCVAEMRDPKNRRKDYFFTTCTYCGPRYSITKNTPYDRKTTTMHDFDMCGACSKEYANPINRRYHAQTTACPECGPKLFFYENKSKQSTDSADALRRAIAVIQSNRVVAVKGVGGFHLVCTTNPIAVQRLRELTGRKHKPFALMCQDIPMVEKITHVSQQEKKILESVERPIVILSKKEPFSAVSELDSLGVMLPYTGLHYLLFQQVKEPLVMTSANLPNAPITTLQQEQWVPFVLDHNRRIQNRVDDSIIKVVDQHPLFVRRSRGWVPQSIPLKGTKETILALGAEQNNVFAIYKNGRAILSPHVGNTSNPDTLSRFGNEVESFLAFTDTIPQIILVDAHSGYATYSYGEKLASQLSVPLRKIYHHSAHAYSVAGENNLEQFSAIVCDGMGLGEDGTIW
ncbi:MAG: carbamoyltransferase HypF, partial [archaeon]